MNKHIDINRENCSNSPSFIDIIDVAHIDKDQLYADLIEKAFFTTDRGKLKLNDGVMGQLYRDYNEMIFANGAFYCPDGMKTDGMVKRELLETISQRITVDIANNTEKAYKALRLHSYEESFDFANKMIIPFKNGDMIVNLKKQWEFRYEDKRPVPYRLPIDYSPLRNKIDTPYFDKWLTDLFYEDDIITLQEYLGYCLLPTTRGQMILLIIGEGGCGKSIINSILKVVFGNAMTTPLDLKQFFDDKFKIAELENQLVFYEDDINDAKLDDSTKFKKFATGELMITADRKFEAPFKFIPYCRIIMCGNHMLKCTTDKSDGFHRRLLPLPTKPKDPTRVNISDFGDKVAAEAKGILQWMLIGLKRFIDNGWKFTQSERSKEYVKDFRGLSDHLPMFMDDCFEKDNSKDFTNEELRIAYARWCMKNDEKPLLNKTVKEWLFNNCSKYGLKMENSNNLIRDGKRSRGFKGGCFKSEWLKPTISI